MDLAYDDRKLLLPGVHDVTMDVVKEHFARFQKSDRRMKLFTLLVKYVDALKRASLGESILIDGSFVMACVDEPEDIDVVLVLPADWDVTMDLKPFQYNLVSKRMVQHEYRLDLKQALSGSEDEATWIGFFAQVRPEWAKHFGWKMGLRKGILRVLL